MRLQAANQLVTFRGPSRGVLTSDILVELPAEIAISLMGLPASKDPQAQRAVNAQDRRTDVLSTLVNDFSREPCVLATRKIRDGATRVKLYSPCPGGRLCSLRRWQGTARHPDTVRSRP